MRSFIPAALLASVLACTPAFAQTSALAEYSRSPLQSLNALRSAPARQTPALGASTGPISGLTIDPRAISAALAQDEEPVIAPPAAGEESLAGSRKSPVKAFFLSLVVPGLGEMYCGRMVRGGVFMAIEAAAWSTWGIFTGRGNDWEDRYIDFRNEHWSFERYDAYRHAVWDEMCAITSGICGDDESQLLPLWRRQDDSVAVLVGSHHYDDIGGREMPSSHDQNEMIGKYDRFSFGWDDVGVYIPDEGVDSTRLATQFTSTGGVWGTDKAEWAAVLNGMLVSPDIDENTYQLQVQYTADTYSANREEYEGMRDKSNKAKNTAQMMVTAVLFNHIISAIDAARLAKSINRDGSSAFERPRSFLRMGVMETRHDHVPMLVYRRYF